MSEIRKVDQIMVGGRVRHLRGSWSQRELAEKVNEQGGHDWFPQTVGAIEHGERALKLDEAATLADVFELRSIDTLTARAVYKRVKELGFIDDHVERAARAAFAFDEEVARMFGTDLRMTFDELPDWVKGKHLDKAREVLAAAGVGRDEIRAEQRAAIGIKEESHV